jgi:haloalkane dehalogenase
MATQNKTLIGALEEVTQSLDRFPLQAIVSALQEIARNTRHPTEDQLQTIVSALQDIAQNTRRPPGEQTSQVGSVPDKSGQRLRRSLESSQYEQFTLPISAEYPYTPQSIAIEESTMSYIEEGAGDPILFLHGNPVWSYVWRNVIPYLSPLGRCIAPDLIGFGRSGKPDIEYSFFDHVKYLESFIEALRLVNITLVIQDWGSGLGFHYAMRHERNVKGIAFFEAMLKPYPSWDVFPASDASVEFRNLFRRFRTGGEGGEGWKLIVDENMFIEQLLPSVTSPRTLTVEEMNYYREPFKEPKSRKPIWRFPQEIPIEGEPAAVAEAVASSSAQLQKSILPKLLFYATPGAILTAEHVQWCRENLTNSTLVDLGEGSHFLQESHPHLMGTELAKWYRKIS